MTMTVMGNVLEISRAHIGNVESGKQSISNSLLKLMSHEFNVNYQWLLDGTGEMIRNGEQTREPSKGTSEGLEPRMLSIPVMFTINLNDCPQLKRLLDLMNAVKEESI